MLLRDTNSSLECSWFATSSMYLSHSCKSGAMLPIICQNQPLGQVGMYSQLANSCAMVFLNWEAMQNLLLDAATFIPFIIKKTNRGNYSQYVVHRKGNFSFLTFFSLFKWKPISSLSQPYIYWYFLYQKCSLFLPSHVISILIYFFCIRKNV